MIRRRLRALGVFAAALGMSANYKSPPTVYYTLSVDPGDTTSLRVMISIEGRISRSVRLGMAIHPEYNDRFWRYLTDWHVDGFDKRAILAIDRENVWRVISHAGYAHVSYRVAVPHENQDNRPVWRTTMRSDGGSINAIDTFLYLADYPNVQVDMRLELPGRVVWDVPVSEGYSRNFITQLRGRLASAEDLTRDRSLGLHAHTDIESLLDSPILFGNNLRIWDFAIDGVPHTVAYWPLPNATPFDTAQFIDAIQKVARQAVSVFGKPPYPRYHFLLEDGGWGALEHQNSVTIGMPSRDLAVDPRAYLSELAHEFFHAWNLMRLYPEGRGKLSVDPPAHSTGLWLSEGVTIYYAEALTRRAGFPERNMSRKDLLAEELEAYYATPGNTRISPQVASERAVDTTGINGDYEPNYYTQGRLIGTALDLLLRDSTRGQKGLDDFMRAMYDHFAMKRGFTTDDVERTANDVCGCNLDRFFDDHVRNPRPIDFNTRLRSVGLVVRIDTVAATDSAGNPFPDTRVWAYPRRSDGRMRVWIHDPTSVWGRAGLHTGQNLVAFNGVTVDSFPDFRRAFRTVRLGNDVPVDILENGRPRRITVRVSGYDRPRVTIGEDSSATPVQIERRRAWSNAR